MERKHELAVLAREEIAQLKQQGYVLIYTDGSAEWVQHVGWVGGYSFGYRYAFHKVRSSGLPGLPVSRSLF